jgi:hypothetical protein
MKRLPVYLILFLILAAAAAWFFIFRGKNKANTDSEPAIAYTSKHSAELNQSLRNMMDAYYSLTEEFVNWDTSGVATYSAALNTSLENLIRNC